MTDALLPTPAVNDMGAGKTPPQWDEWTDRMKRKHGNGNGHGPSLAIEAQRMLPTPMVGSTSPAAHGQISGQFRAQMDAALALMPTVRTENNENRQLEGYGGGKDGNFHELVADPSRFGPYAAAIERWEQVLGRPAPSPTEPTGRNSAHRLSARFTEWMMGVPDGWITDTPGITRNEALKACGNGVVPQQFEALITDCLDTFDALDGAA